MHSKYFRQRRSGMICNEKCEMSLTKRKIISMISSKGHIFHSFWYCIYLFKLEPNTGLVVCYVNLLLMSFFKVSMIYELLKKFLYWIHFYFHFFKLTDFDFLLNHSIIIIIMMIKSFIFNWKIKWHFDKRWQHYQKVI